MLANAVMGGLKQDYWLNYVDSNWVDGGTGLPVGP